MNSGGTDAALDRLRRVLPGSGIRSFGICSRNARICAISACAPSRYVLFVVVAVVVPFVVVAMTKFSFLSRRNCGDQSVQVDGRGGARPRQMRRTPTARAGGRGRRRRGKRNLAMVWRREGRSRSSCHGRV